MYWLKLCLLCVTLYFGTTDSRGTGADLLPNKNICGKHAFDRIVGGERTDLREFTWMALLQYDTAYGRKFLCGGSLISNRYVLTAAHCVKNSLVRVRLGEHDLSQDIDCEDDTPGLEYCADPPLDIDIEEKIVYKSYRPGDINYHGDIALLRLKQEVEFNEFITPICLPLGDDIINKQLAGLTATVAGWGKTENTSRSDVKLKVEVPIKSDSGCTSFYSRHRINLIGSQLCAGGEKGKDSCGGDSGGPLMYLQRTPIEENWYAVGVVSFGPSDCGTEHAPAVYTRTSSYIEWILSNLKP